jgi:hypothetical protein
MNVVGPKTIHKNPYNLPKMDLCVGYSYDKCTEGIECAKCY